MKKGITIIFIVTGMVLIGTLFLFYSKKGTMSDVATTTSIILSNSTDASTTVAQDQSPVVPPPISVVVPQTHEVNSSERLYTNKDFHFSLQYPKGLAAKEYKEPGDALSVTFSDESEAYAFQVYVTPYKEKQISSERFKLDEPSGVRDQPVDVMIDTVRGTMFFGKNGILGDTREVWFIRGGYLYEVTTYRELDAWLAGIMKTWKFTK